ncbi:pimeloyl-ACP methyl ester carboxylesterase [Kribbella kalugense]|uniref:Pimeloyl-ACP methyl ester carboxylesterase n=2 Tax=Kribbella kalugense TaxID=2512221 RepID=A0A4R8A1N5_9ACTN|nr:pimeloyl-ACP methyl ester carboxylesterase [Kribbella kalugense]
MTLALTAFGAQLSAVSATTTSDPTVTWKSCPTYSDDVLRSLGVTQAQLANVRTTMSRLQCGTVSVPLNYSDPGGRTIDIAVTRLTATDHARRLGSVAVLPGGPGGSGYLDPVMRVARNNDMAKLNERYDIIGLDPRGVGYSTKVSCDLGARGPAAPGPLTEAAAKKIYEAQVSANQKCANSDPAFIGQLTTDNVAKDVDRVRAALGDRKLNLLGFSWGTYLGAAYRSLFPAHTGRVFLDSPAPPWTRVDRHFQESAAAVERNFARMAEWLARHNTTYGLGATARQVRAEVLRLVRGYDQNPKTYADLPQPIDGSTIANLAGRDSTQWVLAGQALLELRTASGTTAPPTVKQLLGAPMGAPLPGAPELTNLTMNWAVTCNEDSSRPTFDVSWRDYQRLLKRNPVTGRQNGMTSLCSGWPLPVQQATLKRGPGSLVLGAHLYEYMSVYDWALQTRNAIGGTIYTVRDDVHVSTTRVPECAAEVVTYFETGHIDHGCPGVQPPS